MPTNITMPALSPTMEAGTLARWLKKVGDPIKPGDVLAEIETDKATMEIEAVDEGVLSAIVVADGTEEVKVGTVIGVILGEGEDASAASSAPTPVPAGEGESTPGPTLSRQGEGQRAAQGEGAALSPEVRGYGANPSEDAAIARAEEKAAAATAPPSTAPTPPLETGETRVNASPLARRLAEMRSVSLATLKGTGPGGRIVKADVDSAGSAAAALPHPAAGAAVPLPPAREKVDAVPAPASTLSPQGEGQRAAQGEGAPTPSAKSAPQPTAPRPDIPHEAVKLSNMRKVIARRLTESKQTVPHYYLAIDCRLDALLKLRAELNAAQPIKLSVNDLLIKALAVALTQVPDANVSYTGDNLLKFSRADISVAVAIPAGLITPIIVGADTARLTTIATQMKDLAARAKEGKLQPHEYQGGTASLSNLGMYGIKQFSAVINPPQGMILAVGAGDRRPWIEGDALTAATVLTATGSFDHRAIDGATGAQLMAAVRDLIEKPLGMLA